MSRSYRKTPIRAVVCCHSEKKDKQDWHRRFRRVNRVRVTQGLEPKHYKELSDTWGMGKDGSKNWFGHYKYGIRDGWHGHTYTEEELKEWYKERRRK